jgi:signal peptidase I
LSVYIKKFWAFLRKNETARGLLLVGIVILAAIGVWGGIRLALNTEYPVLVVSSGSMCPPTNCVLPIGSLVVIRGQDPSTIHLRDIIVFRELGNPNFFIIHRVITVYTPQNDTRYPGQYAFLTHGDANPPGANEGPNPASNVLGVYQYTIPIPYLGQAILDVRGFMYNSSGQINPQGILVILALIVALFAFEVIEPRKKPPSNKISDEQGPPVSGSNVSAPGISRY